MRADAKFSTVDVAATAARYAAHVSVTTGSNPSVNAAITQIPDTAWTAIHYPHVFVDTETGQLVSDAEIGDTTFTSRPKNLRVLGRLTVARSNAPTRPILPGRRRCPTSGGTTRRSGPHCVPGQRAQVPL